MHNSDQTKDIQNASEVAKTNAINIFLSLKNLQKLYKEAGYDISDVTIPLSYASGEYIKCDNNDNNEFKVFYRKINSWDKESSKTLEEFCQHYASMGENGDTINDVMQCIEEAKEGPWLLQEIKNNALLFQATIPVDVNQDAIDLFFTPRANIRIKKNGDVVLVNTKDKENNEEVPLTKSHEIFQESINSSNIRTLGEINKTIKNHTEINKILQEIKKTIKDGENLDIQITHNFSDFNFNIKKNQNKLHITTPREQNSQKIHTGEIEDYAKRVVLYLREEGDFNSAKLLEFYQATLEATLEAIQKKAQPILEQQRIQQNKEDDRQSFKSYNGDTEEGTISQTLQNNNFNKHPGKADGTSLNLSNNLHMQENNNINDIVQLHTSALERAGTGHKAIIDDIKKNNTKAKHWMWWGFPQDITGLDKKNLSEKTTQYSLTTEQAKIYLQDTDLRTMLTNRYSNLLNKKDIVNFFGLKNVDLPKFVNSLTLFSNAVTQIINDLTEQEQEKEEEEEILKSYLYLQETLDDVSIKLHNQLIQVDNTSLNSSTTNDDAKSTIDNLLLRIGTLVDNANARKIKIIPKSNIKEEEEKERQVFIYKVKSIIGNILDITGEKTRVYPIGKDIIKITDDNLYIIEITHDNLYFKIINQDDRIVGSYSLDNIKSKDYQKTMDILNNCLDWECNREKDLIAKIQQNVQEKSIDYTNKILGELLYTIKNASIEVAVWKEDSFGLHLEHIELDKLTTYTLSLINDDIAKHIAKLQDEKRQQRVNSESQTIIKNKKTVNLQVDQKENQNTSLDASHNLNTSNINQYQFCKDETLTIHNTENEQKVKTELYTQLYKINNNEKSAVRIGIYNSNINLKMTHGEAVLHTKIINQMSDVLREAIYNTKEYFKQKNVSKDDLSRISNLLDNELFMLDVIQFAQEYGGITNHKDKFQNTFRRKVRDEDLNDLFGIAKELSFQYQKAAEESGLLTGREQGLKQLVGQRLCRIPIEYAEDIVYNATKLKISGQESIV